VAQDVLAALNDSGLDPTHLELELTESILLEPEDTILETVSRWASCGIRLSIDDFGTGYSSLAYLKRFKVDKLKIDRSFIVNLQRDEEDRAIVLAMIQIARSLNLRTIAEGVEDVELAAQLKGMECDEVQGYLYTPPLPAAELTSWLAEREQRTALPGGIS
jgi:EAL domain-containing protein (putative c-di-GMP-specific phosphodiesterase class I)